MALQIFGGGSGGGAGGTDPNAVPKSTVTTKGDLVVGTGSGTVARKAAGADGQILTADSSNAAGLTWTNPAGGLRYLDRMVPCSTGSNVVISSGGTAPGAGDAARSDGASNSCNTLSTHSVLFPVEVIRLVYYGQGGATDSMTVTAGVQDPFGFVYPVTFKGSLTGAVAANNILISDPIVVNFPSGGNAFGAAGGSYFSYFQVRTHAVATGTSGKLLSGGVGSTAVATSPAEGGEYGTSLADKSLTGTITAGIATGVNFVRPTFIVGTPVRGARPVVLGIGDSIVAGTGDTGSGFRPLGFLARALYGVGLPYLVDGTPSARFPDIRGNLALADPDLRPNVPGSLATRNQVVYDGATHAVVNFGHNNLSSTVGNETYTTTQPKSIAYWRWHGRHGTRVWQTTITPRTTTTDAWATVANQTVDSNNANRLAFNAWLRDGAPLDPTTYAAVAVGTSGARRCTVYDTAGAVVTAASGLTHPLTGGVLELADVAESARDSGKWKASATADGVHPNATYHGLLAAALPTSLFI